MESQALYQAWTYSSQGGGPVPPQLATNGAGTWGGPPIERPQRPEPGPPPTGGGRRPPRRRGSSLFAARRARPSPADCRRPRPSPAERSRARPNSAPLPPPPPERRRASKLAAAAAEEAPPQGEEVPARRRPPAAEAAPVAPRRERPAEPARPRGRAGGVDVAPASRPPARRPPPPARRLPSLNLRRATRCPGPSRGRTPGSTQAQDCRWASPLPGNPREHDRTASLKSWPFRSSASAWALPLRQLRCLHWSEGTARHGGSHLPGGPHRHRLQRPRGLLAAAALGHTLLGLPFSLCRRRFSL